MADPVEYLKQAKSSLDQYRQVSNCGYCKEQVEIVQDGLEALIETDANLRLILEHKLGHPGVAALPKVREQFVGARDASRRLVDRLGQREPPRRTSTMNLGFREVPRTLRESIRDIRPGILPRPLRRRDVRER